MTKVKYIGKGISTRGTDFIPDGKGHGLYTLEKADAEYVLKTFPKAFVLIEPNTKPAVEPEAKPADAPAPKKRRTRKTKAKSEDTATEDKTEK